MSYIFIPYIKTIVYTIPCKYKKMTWYVEIIIRRTIAKMWEIFKRKRGKEFYRDSLAFYAYLPDEFEDDGDIEDDYMDDEEIAYYDSQKIKKTASKK